jgi:hypothetical protein
MQGEREALIGFSDEERALFVDFLKRVVRNLERAEEHASGRSG